MLREHIRDSIGRGPKSRCGSGAFGRPRVRSPHRWDILLVPMIGEEEWELCMPVAALREALRCGRLTRAIRRLLFGGTVISGLLSLPAAVGAAQQAIPDFATDAAVGWVASGMGFGTDFVQPPSGPGPVTNDPAHPYVTNVAAAATGKQPTFRVADLTNPILRPWAIEQMGKANQDVLAGKV